jgi:putative transposase
MKYPLVIDLQRDGVAVTLTCEVLGFSRQAFYAWKADPITDQEWADAHLINAAIDIHADDPEFGYRFIADEINDTGITACENRVHRLCKQEGILSSFSKKKGRSKKAGPPVHDDLVQREFVAFEHDEIWLTDITEHWTAEGKLYACVIKDVFSNRIVGWAIDERMTATLAVKALRMAIGMRRPKGTIVHSDRGSQFRSKKFRRVLRNNGLVGSMGRVGACGDNAAMESFFSLLQKNVLDTKRWKTRAELRSAIIRWIERTYNRRRRQRILGKCTPVEYEALNTVDQAA